jgi:hypothetical protein
MTLSPALTKFDERVLAEVPEGRGARVRRIVEEVRCHYQRHTWATWEIPSRDDIIGVLRGLEHLGYIHQRNGGWRR